MAQNQGLLVDVDIEPVSGVGGENGNNGVASPLTLSDKGGGAGEVNSNSAAQSNEFDAIDTIQTYQTMAEAGASRAAGSKHRERNNSVDSTNSIRSYDSTGQCTLLSPHVTSIIIPMSFQAWSPLTLARRCCLTWATPRPRGLEARGPDPSEAAAGRTRP